MFIENLHFKNLKGDFYGGLTAAVVALPLALAMGVSSGAGPIAGLYGAVIVGFFASLFGGTGAQVSGPTGPMTVVMAVIFTHYTTMFPENHAHGVAIAFTVVLLGGLLQILFGALKIGDFVNLMPYPVVSGFMSGIGVIIILLQLAPLLGVSAENNAFDSIMALPDAIANFSNISLILGLITLLIVFFQPKSISKYIPSSLLALIIGTVALVLYGGSEIAVSKDTASISGVSVLGNIPSGFPEFQLPVIELSLLFDMLKSAFTLALLGSIDSLLTSLVADNITRSHHKSNRELIGQGIGNTISGLFGGLPGAGATMRTVVNVRAGGLTPISGALHAVVLLAIALGAGDFAKYIPHAVLAGILIKVGIDIIDWSYITQLNKAPAPGVVIMFVVLLVTVLVDLISAVAMGMVLASFVFLRRMVALQLDNINIYKNKPEGAPVSAESLEILQKSAGDILLFHLKGPLSFGAARGMERRLTMEINPYKVLILDFIDVTHVDYTSSVSLSEMITIANENNRIVYIVGANMQVVNVLKKRNITEDFAKHFKTRAEAIKSAGVVLGI